MTIKLSQNFCEKLKGELSFAFLSPEDGRQLAEYLDCCQVAAGEILWREGEECQALGFIVSGRLEVRKQTEFPGKDVIVGVYGSGSVIGEASLQKNSTSSVTVVALNDSELLLLDRERFEKLSLDHPSLSIKLLRGVLTTVSTRLGKSFERLAAIF